MPYEVMVEAGQGGQDSSEEDPDYKDSNTGYVLAHHPEFKFPITSDTTVGEIKKKIVEKTSKIGKDPINPKNLELLMSKYGEIYETFSDNDIAENIETDGMLLMLETCKQQPKDGEVSIELNYSKCAVGRSASDASSTMIPRGVPRYQVFKY